MTNKQSSRDKIMMGILALVVVAAVWYMLFLTPTNNEIAKLNEDKTVYEQQDETVKADLDKLANRAVQHGILTAQDKNKSNKHVKELLDQAQQIDDFTKIADYPNVKNLQADLNGILSKTTDSVALSYENPVRETNCWRRTISISFKTNGEAKAEEIISNLNKMPNGCLINEVTITLSASDKGDSANVNLKVTVFEFEESSEDMSEETAPAA